MRFSVLCWAFTCSTLLHNIEEALWLPAWSMHAGRWFPPVRPEVFRVAIAIFSGLLIPITAVGSISRPLQPGSYLISGYALAMIANALVPHATLSILAGRYMPGTGTAFLLNAPLGLLLLRQALREGLVQRHVLLWSGPLVVLLFLILVAALLAVARHVVAAHNK